MEHDERCELRSIPVLLAADLGLEGARAEVERRSQSKE